MKRIQCNRPLGMALLLICSTWITIGCGRKNDSVSTLNAQTYPVCSAKAIVYPKDPHWGWEKVGNLGFSCIFENRTTVTLNGGKPACQFRSSDPDGDGWGWEKQASGQFASCRVTSTSTDAIKGGVVTSSIYTSGGGTATTIVNGKVTTSGGYPTCRTSTSDPDGDGWGWEPLGINGANVSCRVAK